MVDYSFGNRLLVVFSILLLLNILLHYNDNALRPNDELGAIQPLSIESSSNSWERANKANELSHELLAQRDLQEFFDYKRCPDGIFRVYIYPLELAKQSVSDEVRALHRWFALSSYAVSEPKNACLFVVIASNSADHFDHTSYKYWEHGGINHLVVFVNSNAPPHTLDTWKAAFVSSVFQDGQFSPNMDLILFTGIPDYSKNSWMNHTQIVEDRREILVSFTSPSRDLSGEEVDLFARCESNSTDCFFDLACSDSPGVQERFQLCPDQHYRAKVALSSTFTLILPSANSNQQRIFEAFKYGSIPVVVGNQPLPFEPYIDWNRAVVRLLRNRMNDVIAHLKKIPTRRIVELRSLGRFYMDNYIGNSKVVARSIFSALRFRLRLSAPKEKGPEVSLLLTSSPRHDSNSTFPKPENFPPAQSDEQAEDVYSLWNRNPAFLDASPSVPFSKVPWMMSSFGQDQSIINKERHPKFAETLSGNHPPEMFTIVMLSYKRDDQVQYTLKQMDHLSFLRAIIVVWNDIERKPPADWPSIHVPIHVVNTSRNSLNNRFLPLDLIETEAVFNMDDDFNVDHEDILFSFRVWRENRDAIVGPNFRLGYVDKDSKGVYDATAKCQYNMVLTSGAFVHKSYLRAYTHDMPEVIRERIDELHNCEDISVNFLVSHITRKAPVKTTPITNTVGKFPHKGLSTRQSHYQERSECILFFTQVYGYNPLVISEYRADSVLYNMKLKQCFAKT